MCCSFILYERKGKKVRGDPKKLVAFGDKTL
jgi:hypothetical protein